MGLRISTALALGIVLPGVCQHTAHGARHGRAVLHRHQQPGAFVQHAVEAASAGEPDDWRADRQGCRMRPSRTALARNPRGPTSSVRRGAF